MTSDFFISNFVGTGSNAEIVTTTMAKLPPNAMLSRSGIIGAKNANMKVIGFMGGLHFNQA